MGRLSIHVPEHFLKTPMGFLTRNLVRIIVQLNFHFTACILFKRCGRHLILFH